MTKDEQLFYAQFHANNRLVWQGHPMTPCFVNNRAYMEWWDGLKPEERKALEDNIDARLTVLEKWKCHASLSPTQPTPQSAVQSSKPSASGPMSGANESPEQPGGK